MARHESLNRVVILIVFALFSVACTDFAAKDDSPVRIMLLGDSITVGYTDNPSWRVPFEFGYRGSLYSRFSQSECNFQFVGHSPEPWIGPWGAPLNEPIPDLRVLNQDYHRGYGGWSIKDIHRNVTNFITADFPDAILLHIGINGIGSSSSSELKLLADDILTATPDAHLVIAQITPYATFNQDVLDYNLYIKKTLVPAYLAEGYHVSSVDLYSLFLDDIQEPSSIAVGRHSDNIVHPSNELYDQMAGVWFEELQRIFGADNCVLAQ